MQCRLTNSSLDCPNKKRAMVSQRTIALFLNRLFIFSRLFGPFGLLSSCSNSDALAIAKSAADRLKLDDPVGQRKQGVILATTNIDARHDGGSTLADENGASCNAFTAIGFHAEALGIGVASVTG